MTRKLKAFLFALLMSLSFFSSSANAQLENLLVALQDDSASVLHGRPIGSTPFYSVEFLTLVASIDSIMASLQKYGQSIDNYASVATAYADAKARSGLLFVPRNSKLFQDSTITAPVTADSIVVFDLRDGELKILGTTTISATSEVTNSGDLTLTSDDDNSGAGDIIFRFGPDTSMVIKGDDGKIGINEVTPTTALHLTSQTALSPAVTLENQSADATAPIIAFKKNRAAPADDDQIGAIVSSSDNLAGSSVGVATDIYYVRDVSTGIEAAGWQRALMMNGTQRSFIIMTGFKDAVLNTGEVRVNDGGEDIDLVAEGTSVASLLHVDAGTNRVGIRTNSPDDPLHVAIDDAVSSTVTDAVTIEHTTSGTPSASIGVGLTFNVEDLGGSEEQGSIDVLLTTVTNGGEIADMPFKANGAVTPGTVNEFMRWDGSAGGLVVTGMIGMDAAQTITLGVAATTFSVTRNYVIVTGHGGTNTIATISAGLIGYPYVFEFVDGLVTFTDDNSHAANSMDLSAAFTGADDTTITMSHNGVSWYELSRSPN